MGKGSGTLVRSVWVEFKVECGRCEEEASTKLGDIDNRADAVMHFKAKGWKIRKCVWVCPGCLRNEAIGNSPLAARVAEAAQKAADKISGEARKERDRSLKAVAKKDAADFRTIRDLAKAGDLDSAAKHYGNMDTAARDYLECDDEVLGALGYERIGRRR